DLGWCDIRVAAPGVLGAPEQAPFDRILVSAEAQVLPESLVDQLGPGGVMVITVASRLLRVVRYEDDDVRVTQHGLYRFVDLIVYRPPPAPPLPPPPAMPAPVEPVCGLEVVAAELTELTMVSRI